jgi:hypothetical protein
MFPAGSPTVDVSMADNDIPAIEAYSAQLFHDSNTAMPSNLAVHTHDEPCIPNRIGVIQVFLDLAACILEAVLCEFIREEPVSERLR